MAKFAKLWPEATIARFDGFNPSDNPTYLAQRERLHDGLRRAGLPAR
jgi:hypothetical protein